MAVNTETTYAAALYGDYQTPTPEATVANTEHPSATVDAALFSPAGMAEITIAGSTAGDIYFDISRDGLSTWTQTHTIAYTADGTVIVPLTDIGYGHFIRARVTDSSSTAGTILGVIVARGG